MDSPQTLREPSNRVSSRARLMWTAETLVQAVLLTVVREGPIRLSVLAESESLNPTMLSRVIADLSDAGLVARTSDDGDRRAAWVEATDDGRQLAQRMRRERTDAVNEAMEGLSPSERRVLEVALPALEHLAEQLKDRRP